MKKWVNGKIIEMTDDEIAAFEEEAKRQAEIERKAPPTMDERVIALEAAMLAMLGGNV